MLAGDLPERLRKNVARQLALLNTETVGLQVARHAMRLDGPFASLTALDRKCSPSILSAMSEIDAEAVVKLLERILNPLTSEELKGIGGDLRRELVMRWKTSPSLRTPSSAVRCCC